MFPSFNARALGLTLTACQTVELAARFGFGGADLLVRDLDEAGEDLSAIADLFVKHALRPGAWPLPMNWRNDQAAFDRDLDQLPKYAKIAKQLGLVRTCTWVEPASLDHSKSIAKHQTRIWAIATILEDHGVRLGLEVIGVESFREGIGKPLYHKMGSDAFGELFSTLRTRVPTLGLTVDAFHLYAAEESIRVWEQFGIGAVVWVHLADLPANACGARTKILDADRGLPGEHGAVDCRGLLERLAELGFTGPVTAEPMSGCRSLADLSVEEIAWRTGQSLSQVWPREDQTGTASRFFSASVSELIRLGAISSR